MKTTDGILLALNSAESCTVLSALCSMMEKAEGEPLVEAYRAARRLAVNVSKEWLSCVQSHWDVAKRENRAPTWAW